MPRAVPDVPGEEKSPEFDHVEAEAEVSPSASTNQCDMCRFLFVGYNRAHSKQAKAEYGEGFLLHYTKFHHHVFGDV